MLILPYGGLPQGGMDIGTESILFPNPYGPAGYALTQSQGTEDRAAAE